MLRERIALVYDLLTLGDDFFDLKEIVGLGNASKRYDPTADNQALHEYLADTVSDVVSKGWMTTAVGGYLSSDGSAPIDGLSLRDQILHYLSQSGRSPLSSFGIMVTPAGEEVLASLMPLKLAV